MTTLDIGCGFKKHPDAIGIDRIAGSNADALVDLDHLPYPFKDNCMDKVYCMAVMEHLHDVIGVMEEIWRIAKPGADVYIRTPTMSSVNLHTDPTHLRGFVSRSFDYFVEGEELFKYGYSHARFEKVSVVYDKESRHQRRFYDRFIAVLATKKPLMYESRLAYIFPLTDITFHLKVAKNE